MTTTTKTTRRISAHTRAVSWATDAALGFVSAVRLAVRYAGSQGVSGTRRL